MRFLPLFLSLALATAAWSAGSATDPIRLHPENPRRFLFRGQPTVLLTVGESYGSLINGRFDFHPYFNVLAADGLNHTRVFAGTFRAAAPAGTGLSPRGRHDAVLPWAWSDQPGGFDGVKFDLDRWNPAYFERLQALLTAAGERGIVVELVLFCSYYNDRQWDADPLNAANNIQGEGTLRDRREILTLRHPGIVARQRQLVDRLVRACRDFDNVYFEIANEGYWSNGGPAAVTAADRAAWHQEMIRAVLAAEAGLPPSRRHMIAINDTFDGLDLSPVSVLNFHYLEDGKFMGAMQALDRVHLDKALMFDETEFTGSKRVRRYTPADARAEAWEFMLGGGSGYSNLAHEFYQPPDEGDTSPAAVQLRSAIGRLKLFLDGLDLVRLRRDTTVLAEPMPPGVFARASSDPGKFYAVYFHQSDWGGGKSEKRRPSYEIRPGNYRTDLALHLP
ncbi:MAG: hypothetical protein HYV75_05045, partial [Opitutae bacterium]|nr:hypothetical protein [Opitutae bacterium]